MVGHNGFVNKCFSKNIPQALLRGSVIICNCSAATPHSLDLISYSFEDILLADHMQAL